MTSRTNNAVSFPMVLIRVALVSVCLLFIPLIAMQFSEQVNWSPFDFFLMGFLLFGFGSVSAWLVRKFPNKRMPIVIVCLLAFFYLWAELAVGIFTQWGR